MHLTAPWPHGAAVAPRPQPDIGAPWVRLVEARRRGRDAGSASLALALVVPFC